MNETDSPFAPGALADASSPPAAVGGESPFGYPPQPPLGIGHLLLWTLGTAIALALSSYWGKRAEIPQKLVQFFNVQQVLFSMPLGAMLGGLGIFVYRRLKGGPAFPTQPGHWLLLVYGVVYLCSWVAMDVLEASRAWLEAHGFEFYLCYAWISGGVDGLAALGQMLACWRVPERGRWGWYFGLAAGFDVCTMLVLWLADWSSPYQAVHIGGSVILLLVLIAALTTDLWRRTGRDWLHWTGVGAVLSLGVLTLVFHWWQTQLLE